MLIGAAADQVLLASDSSVAEAVAPGVGKTPGRCMQPSRRASITFMGMGVTTEELAVARVNLRQHVLVVTTEELQTAGWRAAELLSPQQSALQLLQLLPATAERAGVTLPRLAPA